MTRYYLSPSVHWCAVSGHCILLDVATDRYLQLPVVEFEALLPFVSTADRKLEDMPAELNRTAQDLLAVNVLLRNPRDVIQTPQAQLPRPATLVSRLDRSARRAKSFRIWLRFITACVSADYCLRHTSLNAISIRVSQRKRQFCSGPSPYIGDEGVSLVSMFNALRPFYPRNYLCMFDSLALIEFLANWRLFPEWVFGVNVDPFQAHCWVQSDDVVLSDTLGFSARWFSPIMTI
jgi:Transglutaminase-like superfamily